MFGKIIGYSIVFFWLTMTTLFIKKEILPTLPQLTDPSYKAILKHLKDFKPSQMGIYLFNKRIGYTKTVISRQPDNNYYKITNITKIEKIPSGQIVLPAGIDISGYSLVNLSYQLDSFDFSITSPMINLTYQIKGKVNGSSLELNIWDGKKMETSRRPFQPNTIVSHGFSPFTSMPHLSVGKQWASSMINPLSGQVESTTARVEEKTTLVWQEKEYEVYEVVLDYKKFQFRAWITPAGDILKQEALIPGLYLLKEE
ncbi:MAG: hypothetical protein AAB019_03965 [Planctomycetota bacterium]